MDANRIAARFEETTREQGYKAGMDYLRGVEKEMSSALSNMRRIVKQAEQLCIERGLATYIEDKPREIAPSKEKFIEIFGQEAFDAVKSYSRPRRIFTWLI